MKKEQGLHFAQVAILCTLRHEVSARFSNLQSGTGLTSDSFKFHVQKLLSAKLITKTSSGEYELTPKGKEFANRLDESTGLEIRQPKSSMLLVARTSQKGNTLYLAHMRTREPFYGYWGIASAPVLRGVPIKQSAHEELLKQTGIGAEFTVRGHVRNIDRTPQGEVLEDKMFTILVTDLPDQIEPHEWHGGNSKWMSKSELLGQSKLFPATELLLDMLSTGQQFAEIMCTYATDEY